MALIIDLIVFLPMFVFFLFHSRHNSYRVQRNIPTNRRQFSGASSANCDHRFACCLEKCQFSGLSLHISANDYIATMQRVDKYDDGPICECRWFAESGVDHRQVVFALQKLRIFGCEKFASHRTATVLFVAASESVRL